MAPNKEAEPPESDQATDGKLGASPDKADALSGLNAEPARIIDLRCRLAEAESRAEAAAERAQRAKAALAAAEKRVSEAEWLANTAGRDASKADTAVALATRRAVEAEVRAFEANKRAELAERERLAAVQEAERERMAAVQQCTEAERRLARLEERTRMLRANVANATDNVRGRLSEARIPLADLGRSRMLRLVGLVSRRPHTALQRVVQALDLADQSLATSERLKRDGEDDFHGACPDSHSPP
jgi:chromosome segregation ATPase